MIAPFSVPDGAEASAPPTAREDVRLLVAQPGGTQHASFSQLADFLSPGDLLVVNTSATLPAAVEGRRADGRAVLVHFASELDDGTWVVEPRPGADATGPIPDAEPQEVISLPDGVRLLILEPHPAGQHRLWRAKVGAEGGILAFLARHGRPIRYAYVPVPVPLAEYQTVFATEPGSAEMPSAGRPFTDRLVTGLVSRGVVVAPITLHTGVSSQQAGEPPQPERFRVPATTARLANATRRWGNRVIAVGTTVTRALESAADDGGLVRPRSGWTDLVLTPRRPARVVRGLITGWHAPGASHLDLLQAVAGEDLVQRAYSQAVRGGYRWHEFGDSCLFLP